MVVLKLSIIIQFITAKAKKKFQFTHLQYKERNPCHMDLMLLFVLWQNVKSESTTKSVTEVALGSSETQANLTQLLHPPQYINILESKIFLVISPNFLSFTPISLPSHFHTCRISYALCQFPSKT